MEKGVRPSMTQPSYMRNWVPHAHQTRDNFLQLCFTHLNAYYASQCYGRLAFTGAPTSRANYSAHTCPIPTPIGPSDSTQQGVHNQTTCRMRHVLRNPTNFQSTRAGNTHMSPLKTMCCGSQPMISLVSSKVWLQPVCNHPV
jgi:hypothetical protein